MWLNAEWKGTIVIESDLDDLFYLYFNDRPRNQKLVVFGFHKCNFQVVLLG